MSDRLPETCLHRLVEAAARSNPAAPAILWRGERVPYDVLIRRANGIAEVLRRRGVGEGSIVALALPRSPDLIAAQLAVMKSGAAYMVLDRSHPIGRNRLLLDDARPAMVVTHAPLARDLGVSSHALLLDEDASRAPAVDAEEGVSADRPDSIAYVTYTSGSTGRPKGVLTAHRGAANYLRHMIAARRLRPGERVLQCASLSFDASVRDTVGALAFGGTIVLLEDGSAHDPLAQLEAIRGQQATLILSLVPTTLRALTRAALEAGPSERNPRLIMVGGEVLWRTDVERARAAFGANVEIVNQYGATECSMVATDYPVPDRLSAGEDAVPIGTPIAGARVYILDGDGEPVPDGAAGDLYIAGAGVGPGYLDRPDLTAERFLPDPHAPQPGARMYWTGDHARRAPDGSIRYLGRTDQQVKVRGNRVELGEIESVLREHPAVRDAAVALRTDPGAERLEAFVVASGERSMSEVRAFLNARLPFFMIPARFQEVETLPLTSSGKIDRRALLHAASGESRAEGTSRAACDSRALRPLEMRLVSIWRDVLGVETVRPNDGFFELGGDSLMAATLLARIEAELGRRLEIRALLENGSIEALATYLETNAQDDSHPGIVCLQPRGSRTPLFVVSAHPYLRPFALAFAPHRSVHGLPLEQTLVRPIEEEALVLCQSLLAFHPEGPYLLVGHSAAGYHALEIARHLMRMGKRVEFVGLVDTLPPGRRRQAAPLERLQLHLENLRGKRPREVIGYAFQSGKRAAVRVARHAPDNRMVSNLLTRGRAVPIAEALVLHRYEPDPFSGPVTVFVATNRPWYVRWDPMKRWACYLRGRVEVVPVAGDHMSIIMPPRAAALARTMEAMLSAREAPVRA